MIKELVKVEIDDDYKNEAISLIENTIEEVLSNHNQSLSQNEKNKIKNLALDQVNVSVTSKANLRSLWVINTEDSIPLIIEKEPGAPTFGELLGIAAIPGKYMMRSNYTWTYNRENMENGIEKDAFENKVREMLLEDIETAAFYGALSYVGDEVG